ncbi:MULTISPECIES: TRAP transporter large permease [Gemmobacter]|jgi:tripartite ATP-independent transporter DctM subunit|uniref:TRAP transporter large permease protein n=2 Tax=Gemmobacter TaxID=204456 RepID=A0A2T6ATE0_9RHOB|nr:MULTISPECIES: TRAP transporter large permease subunit [Gemmobacter]OJY36230.1 MAG: C4-dicarboxylate ABC transporter [Rhodobacterales bacterium 65-51]PTX47082.1 tripartite ATP-independent transporter DctM subunit [Gemmobacter caeni]TWI96061.1 tripartite ATP-independent transporter DctM subunit [Gemmobacter caeni]GHC26383.1 C4-dicarboxylate ABC transporter [Gemmobacter nanjingensis]
MERLEIGFAGIAAIMLLIGIRVPIGVAMGSTAFFGIWAMMGFKPAVGITKAIPFNLIGDWNLSAIPMFLFMGFVAVEAGLTRGLFGAARIFLARIPGGLASSTVFASALFGAASGSSVATSAAFSRIAVPEMLHSKYDPGLATGSVAASGTLAALIPPSVLMIVYCLLVDTSINTLFMAGVLPGILTALAFITMITLRCMLKPSLAPRYVDQSTRAEKWALLRDAWPLPVVTAIVMGGIFTGAFTATESGAVGAFLACVIAALRGRLNRPMLVRSVIDTAAGTSAIFMIVLGAALFARFVALATIPNWVMGFFEGYDTLTIILLICVLLVLMGTFMEEISIMLLTMPVLVPLLHQHGVDLTWFGILVIKLMTIGLISPPVGMNVFVIKTSLGDRVSLNQIFAGVSWFIAVDLLVLALLIGFPQIALWLPGMMSR